MRRLSVFSEMGFATRWRGIGLAMAWLFTMSPLPAGELVEREWAVEGATRTGLVSEPAAGGVAPLVLVFHGHGGSARQAARSFKLHDLWPEARVIYPDGLPTPGQLTDPKGRRAGWQAAAGDQDDRDLAFFDAILAGLRADGTLDPRRVYATGHSNGGAFVYLLWAERGDAVTAVASSAALLNKGANKLRPKPALHLAGLDDKLVKLAWQERMIDHVLRVNGGGPRAASVPGERRYPPRDPASGAETVVWLHDGGHRFTPEGARRIAEFFRGLEP